ncbi:hypothetical protein [Diaminobutyricimonas sp. LJ205]|uniref:hypothetical protein n=1 Tax=Diaminobutyricimonas sp. LJ205 TaxID=2683590 RepID=UPI0012F503B0|nr:hypothetical protein [Diaminobutyricimonas sp. LJ205]
MLETSNLPPADESAAQPSGSAPARRKSWKLTRTTVALVVAVVVAVTGWGAFAATMSNLNRDLTAALADNDELGEELDEVSGDLDKVIDERDGLKARADEIAKREGEVAILEASVKAREDVITAKETAVAATTLMDGRVYTVGLSMEPGQYRAESTSGRCYWKITRSGTNYSDIVDNDLGTLGLLTVTVGAGQDFQSHDCGDWIKVG